MSNNIELMEQIHNAFKRTPNLAGAIHGARRVHEGQRGKSTTSFPSRKGGGTAILESRLELAHALALERNPEVVRYRTNAIRIQLDENRYVIPDFLIKNSHGFFEVHEVKASIINLSERDQLRYGRIEKILAANKIFFKLVDQPQLMSREDTDRLLHLYSRGHRYDWSPLQIFTATKLLERRTFNTLSDVHSTLAKEGIPESLGDYLVFHNKVNISGTALLNWRQ